MTTIEQGARKFLGLDSTDPNYRHTDDDIKELSIFKAGVEFAQRWISVEEELPTEDKEYLVKIYNKHVGTLYWDEYYKCFDDESGDDYFSDAVGGKVTHWRPITIE